jgi:glycosyltransferase involved in cell wall biosynthesis
MSSPRISVVMTTFNSKDFVQEQLDSIVAQSYKNWELIISDDASTDHTLEILSDYVKRHHNVKIHLLRNAQNLGQAKNFERALTKAQGEFIAISDSDDYWEPLKLEKQLGFLEKNPQVSLNYHDLSITDKHLNIISGSLRNNLANGLRSAHVENDSLSSLLVQNHISAATMMFRKEMTKLFLPYPPKISKDYWMVLVTSALNYKIGYIDEPLMKYRQHSANVTGGKVKNKHYFLNGLTSKKFGEKYFAQTSEFILALNRIEEIALPQHKPLVIEKIRILKALLGVLTTKTPWGYACHVVYALSVILLSKQRYHFGHFVYFSIYKLIPKKH